MVEYSRGLLIHGAASRHGALFRALRWPTRRAAETKRIHEEQTDVELGKLKQEFGKHRKVGS